MVHVSVNYAFCFYETKMLRKDAHSVQRDMAAGAAALRRECASSAHFHKGKGFRNGKKTKTKNKGGAGACGALEQV